MYDCGDEHGANGAASSEHWKLRAEAAVALSLPVKVNVASTFVVVAAGCPVIVVSGAVVSSTIHV